MLRAVSFTAIWKYFKCLHSNFTSAQGNSWVLVQRYLLPHGKKTYFRCSAASGQMSPTICCCRCWGSLLPESLFSSTPPIVKHQNCINKLNLSAGLPRYLTFGMKTTVIEIRYCECFSLYYLLFSLFKAFHVQLKLKFLTLKKSE